MLNKDQIIKSLSKATGLPESEIKLYFPEREEHGDYATNVAFHQSPITSHQSPYQIAEKIIEKLKTDKDLNKIVDKIEVAGPGFINFFLSKEALLDTLVDINNEKDAFGKSDLLKGKRIMFEFGQPNTHKLPHIGHLFSYIYGASMTNILELAGSKLRRVNYQGDIGPHVAKCLWAFERGNPSVPSTLEGKVNLLQKMYQKGAQAFEKDEKTKTEILEINKKIYLKKEPWFSLWQKTRGWNLEYYKKFEKRLGVSYDRYYFESEVEEMGKKIVENNIGEVFEKSEGALIFKGSKVGLHDRVFVTKYGTPTYEAKDMYLQKLKMEEWPYDLLIITTAHEQNEYFKVVFKALGTLDTAYKGKLMHIGFGMVNLKSGKMSSRTGEIVSAVDLVDKVVEKVSQINKDKKIAEAVGLGAVKYSFLKNNPLQDTKFDIEESIAQEGNSGPYLQYTHARTQSVLRKAKPTNHQSPITNHALSAPELSVLRFLPRFPQIVENAAKTYSPNLICNYLFDLAQRYNNFYNSNRILGEKSENFRLALTLAVGQILKTSLNLLGIKAPERM